MGTQAGAHTYQDSYQKEFDTAGQQEIQRYSAEIGAAMQKYSADIAQQTGLSGQALQKYISDQGNATSIKLSQMGLDAQQTKDIMSGLGFVLQAGSWILSALLAKGTEYAAKGEYTVGEKGPEIAISEDKSQAKVVGENGPEKISLEQGDKVIPNDPHDGYAMLERVYSEAMPKIARYKVGAFSPPAMGKPKLSDIDLGAMMEYLKGAK
jgi:hypothetical protein